MRPTSTRALAEVQENYIAKKYNGTRSKSSGANPFDRGDVRFTLALQRGMVDETRTHYARFDCIGECKATEKQSHSVKKSVWDKIKQEAQESGRVPHLFLRFVDENGKHTDLVVREVNDDLELLDV